MTHQTDLIQVLSLPGRNSVATQELVFLASHLQPLGLTTFLLHREEQVENGEDKDVEENDDGARRWLMGKEGGLRLEASSSSSEIRLVDPSRGIDIEVISSWKEITHGDPMHCSVCVWLQEVVRPAFYHDHFFLQFIDALNLLTC